MVNETINPWKVVSEKEVYDNPWIKLTAYEVINPSGGEGIYGKVHFKNRAIAILVLDEDKNTYLVGQYRFVLNAYSWEIPEGGCPEGEYTLDAAKRELLEETGLVASNWKELMRSHLSNSIGDEFAIIYLAQDLVQKTAMPEETEQLVVRKIAFAEAVTMVNDGRITDALSILAIQKLQLMILANEI
ncbi:MAG TPA: NUDIX hydrolase [Niabella sp.]|nr:NUDIX hydrolase [Niabella sp.]HQW15074.1 NUDIX hydrolase [Niabella sp.]HQX20215.1 NUDIX hydrolase [Niabella sp.]HQX41294.1 NUDIX hydrolase [Niabella sp.]HRB35527.1 NUDIX hydrolase [Niabella sp.]